MHRLIPLLFLITTLTLSAQEKELKTWTFYSEKDTVKQIVTIPHTWNANDAFDDEPGYWRGKGFYTKEIFIEDVSKKYFLHFNGANQVTKVWVNGRFAGEHIGGYTAFDIDITAFLVKGKNALKVGVDNSHNETIPPLDADFTFYGGIYRQVFLVEENSIHFDKKYGTDAIKIDAELDENFNGQLKVSGAIFNDESQKCVVKISIPELNKSISIKKITNDFLNEIIVDSPKLWSPNNPQLYEVNIEIFRKNKLIDSYKHKIGFRKIEAATNGFKLNGKPVKLVGVNRHQDLEGYGNAVPVKKQIQDLVMIKEMGANFLRLAHYPQDKEIYKAADSLGLILWSEIPVVNKVPFTADYEDYKINSLRMQQEHIAQNYNHPSLVFVGYMNEIFLRMVFDKPEEQTKQKIIKNTLELAKELENLTRKEAPNHISVMALHGNQMYNETGIADVPMVIGWNLYYGWYGGRINELGGFLDDEFTKYPQRPLIISEYGVGADVRIHNDNPKRFDFSEEYQFEYHPGYYKQVDERDFVIGMAAWNFADFGSEFRGDAMPHINQKGLVNFDRTPKNIFHWYKAALKPNKKMGQFFKGLQKYIADDNEKEVKIITNQKVILKDNYGYRTELKPFNNLVSYYANLIEGKNVFELYDETGKILDSLQIHYYKPDLRKIDELAVNFGTESYFKDSYDRIWVPLKEVSIINIKGEVKNSNTSTNIKETVDDPLYQSSVSDIEEIYIDVPKGSYEITIKLSKHGKNSALVYELSKEQNSIESGETINTLLINENPINIPHLEPFSKTDLKLTIDVDLGILIRSPKGKFSVSGILLKKKK
ncbi:MAG: glycoside hydrolase family 2 TIM barrel-domain containing protein [Flavobacteriaceae bacterium]